MSEPTPTSHEPPDPARETPPAPADRPTSADQGSQPAWGGLQPYAPGPPRTNAFAIASLVCSLAGLVTGISVIAGIVLGHIALNQIKQTGEEGRSFAIAGLAIGYGLLAVGFLILVAAVFLVAILGAYTTTVGPTNA